MIVSIFVGKRFEKEREKKRAAHRREILRKESQIAQHLSRIRHLEVQLYREAEKLKFASDEFANLCRVRYVLGVAMQPRRLESLFDYL